MRVGIVVSADQSSGGIFQYTYSIINALIKSCLPYNFTIFSLVPKVIPSNIFTHPRWQITEIPLNLITTDNERRPFLVGDGLDLAKTGINQRAKAFFHMNKIDLLIYPAPITLSFECGVPYVMAIHDLQHRLQPEFPEVSAGGGWAFREYLFRNGARYAMGILADSDVGREDILRCYGNHIFPDHVHALPFLPSYSPQHNAPSDPQKVQVIKKYHLPQEFLFYPAQFWMHKNHSRLIHAIHHLRANDAIDCPLVLSGSNTGPPQEARDTIFANAMLLAEHLGIGDLVHYLGYVPDDEMPALYALTKALVMPTFFGPTNIPILEAWAFNCPVITSDLQGIREQVQEAGLLAAPDNPWALSRAIKWVWTDEILRMNLKKLGQSRLASYTREDFSERLISIIKAAVEEAVIVDIRQRKKQCQNMVSKVAQEPFKSAPEMLTQLATDTSDLLYPTTFTHQDVTVKSTYNPRTQTDSYEISSFAPSKIVSMAASSTEFEVSSVVSTYKSEVFIRGCLNDLTQQTLFHKGQLEIIVIDSASPENELSIVRQFQSRYGHERIKYYRTSERESLYTAWNRAIKAASGRYITNANTDDRHRPDAFEVMARWLDANSDIALVYANQLISTVPNDSFISTKACRRTNWPEYSYEDLRRHCFMGSQPMWRKELHDKYGMFREDYRSAGDYEFWLRIGAHEKFQLIDEVLGLYYLNPNGIEVTQDAPRGETLQVCREYNINPRDRRGSHTLLISGQELFSYPYRSPKQVSKIQPLFSIIVPYVHDRSHLLQTILSIALQTIDDFEILICGSKLDQDNAAKLDEMICFFAQHHIRYIENDISNNAILLNDAFLTAKGEYILLIPQSDYIQASMLERCKELLMADPDLSVVYSDLAEAHHGQGRILHAPDFAFEALQESNRIHSSVALRRETWNKLGGFISSSMNDPVGAIIVRCAQADCKSKRIPEPLSYCRNTRVFDEGTGHDVISRDLTNLSGENQRNERNTEMEDYTQSSSQVDYWTDDGQKALAEGRWLDAETLFERSVIKRPFDARAYSQLAEARWRAGKMESALEVLTRALELNPNDGHVTANTVLVFHQLDRNEEAQAILNAYIERNPWDQRIHKDIEERKTFQKSEMERSMENPAILFNSEGEIQYTKGYKDRARVCFELALEHDSQYAKALNNLGVTYWEEGDLRQSLQCFEQALDLTPNDPDVLHNSARVLMLVGETETAIEYMQIYLSRFPQDQDAWKEYRLWVESSCDGWANADLPDNVAEIYGTAGRALAEAGDILGAAHAFRRVLAFHPDDASTIFQLGQLHQKKDQTEDAFAMYRLALSKDPTHRDSIQAVAETAHDSACRSEAISLMKDFLVHQQDDEIRNILNGLVDA